MLEKYVALDVKKEFGAQASRNNWSQVNYVLRDFNVTRAMKLLYFTCLISVDEKNNKSPNLFNTFDNFLAYPNGPVEEDVYSNCSLLFTFRKKAGEDYLETLQSRPEDMSQIEELRFDEYKNNNSESINLRKAMIDDAVKKLSNTTEYNFPVRGR